MNHEKLLQKSTFLTVWSFRRKDRPAGPTSSGERGPAFEDHPPLVPTARRWADPNPLRSLPLFRRYPCLAKDFSLEGDGDISSMFTRDVHLQFPALHEAVTSAADRALESQGTNRPYQVARRDALHLLSVP